MYVAVSDVADVDVTSHEPSADFSEAEVTTDEPPQPDRQQDILSRLRPHVPKVYFCFTHDAHPHYAVLHSSTSSLTALDANSFLKCHLDHVQHNILHRLMLNVVAGGLMNPTIYNNRLYTVFRKKRTHARFVLYIHGKWLDLHKILWTLDYYNTCY